MKIKTKNKPSFEKSWIKIPNSKINTLVNKKVDALMENNRLFNKKFSEIIGILKLREFHKVIWDKVNKKDKIIKKKLFEIDNKNSSMRFDIKNIVKIEKNIKNSDYIVYLK